MEKVAATSVGPEDRKRSRRRNTRSKHAKTSPFCMPLGIKVAKRIQKEFFYPESDYVGPLGFCLKLAAGALSVQKYRFPLHLMSVPWKKDRMRPL